jgi:hypothetical protein
MSAKNTKDVERLLAICQKYLPEQPWMYGADDLTDRSERFMAAEIVREKGTNRSRFLRGEVDKYTWVDEANVRQHPINLYEWTEDPFAIAYQLKVEARNLGINTEI